MVITCLRELLTCNEHTKLLAPISRRGAMLIKKELLKVTVCMLDLIYNDASSLECILVYKEFSVKRSDLLFYASVVGSVRNISSMYSRKHCVTHEL